MVLKRTTILSLADLAYNSVIAAIIDQQFRPGDPLNISELARQLDMSNTPIREALARATSERLVKQVSNKGYMVAPLLSEAEYINLFDTRILLESYAIKHSQSVKLQELRHIITEMSQVESGTTFREYREVIEYDRCFHKLLVDSANNLFVSRAWRDLHCHLHQNRLRYYDTSNAFHLGYAIQEHNTILEYLENGDMTAAAEANMTHLRNTQNRIMRLLDKQPQPLDRVRENGTNHEEKNELI